MRTRLSAAALAILTLLPCENLGATTRDDPPPRPVAATTSPPDGATSQPATNPPNCNRASATCMPTPPTSATETATSEPEPQKKAKPLPPEIAAGIALPLIQIQLPPITDEELLRRAQKALREAEFLSFDLVTTAPPSIIVRAEARMARDRLYSRFFVRDTDEPAFKVQRLTQELLIIGHDAREIAYNSHSIDRIDASFRSPYFGGTGYTVIDGPGSGYG